MTVTAALTCFLEPPTAGGVAVVKQGAAVNHRLSPLSITVDGTKHERAGSLATASAATIYDSSINTPTSWDVAIFWCDTGTGTTTTPVHLQLIDVNAPGTNVIVSVTAYMPVIIPAFMLGASASETAITNGTTTLRQVDKILLGNSSGSTLNYVLLLVT